MRRTSSEKYSVFSINYVRIKVRDDLMQFRYIEEISCQLNRQHDVSDRILQQNVIIVAMN
jgi:hypothetical protein